MKFKCILTWNMQTIIEKPLATYSTITVPYFLFKNQKEEEVLMGGQADPQIDNSVATQIRGHTLQILFILHGTEAYHCVVYLSLLHLILHSTELSDCE